MAFPQGACVHLFGPAFSEHLAMEDLTNNSEAVHSEEEEIASWLKTGKPSDLKTHNDTLTSRKIYKTKKTRHGLPVESEYQFILGESVFKSKKTARFCLSIAFNASGGAETRLGT